ncbi:DNA damage tolerance protein RHC31 [Candida viswanathii]|uniref:DNA damage tolerance protein RHC31 n=1 Tax=Candida viswanathii TaxID=5486 RepID=A0A367YLU2_9ASCO|nr:DNA damage tolerance protein RHC31 [Candida viswanathii]
MASNGTDTEQLTADEIALYDRQIRLWGITTQLRLRTTKVLIINLNGIGTEVVKNLVLGGINTIEILDDAVVRPEDFACQFFLPNDDCIVGELKLPFVVEHIRELNSRVNLDINTSALRDVDRSYFKRFDLIIGTDLNREDMVYVDGILRELNIPLYLAGAHGMFGYVITDLIKHESAKEQNIGNVKRVVGTKVSLHKTITKLEPVESEDKDEKEVVTITDEFTPVADVFTSKKLKEQLTKRQFKKVSPAFPILFALLGIERPRDVEEDVPLELLKEKTVEVCRDLDIPVELVTEEYYKLLSRQAFTEFAPVSAILGGALSQDVIQFLSKKESPINNVLILDSIKLEMPIYQL